MTINDWELRIWAWFGALMYLPTALGSQFDSRTLKYFVYNWSGVDKVRPFFERVLALFNTCNDILYHEFPKYDALIFR